MSSANKIKRGDFEQEFWHRMHDAEASPAPDLWARIDHELTVQENRKYKKHFVLYRQLAAACFVLFMLAGALLVYRYNSHDASSSAFGVQQVDIASNVQVSEAGKKTVASVENSNGAEGAAQKREGGIHLPGATALYQTEPAADRSSHKAINERLIEYREQESSPSAARYIVQNNESSFSVSNTPQVIATSAVDEIQSDVLNRSARRAIAAVPATTNEAGKTNLFGTTAGGATLPKTVRDLNEHFSRNSDLFSKADEALALALNKEQEKGSTAKSRWSVSMGYMPSYFNQNIGLSGEMADPGPQYGYGIAAGGGPATSKITSENMEAAKEEYEKNTTPAFSYTAEVRTGFRLNRKLKLLTGIGYSQNTARTKTSYIIEQFWFKPRTNERFELAPSTIFLPSLNNSFSTDSLNIAQTETFDVDYRYRHLTIPLGLQYEGKIGDDWFWYTTGGVAANFLLESTIMTSNEQVGDIRFDNNDESPFRKVQFSGNVGAGVGRRISENVTVAFGPEVRRFFSSMLADSDQTMATQGKPYVLGLNMGVNYLLGHSKK